MMGLRVEVPPGMTGAKPMTKPAWPVRILQAVEKPGGAAHPAHAR